ncbi:MAG: hypothetical protein ACFFBD_16505 [Candidatus Hodarchaeota archaeon]
MVKKTQIIRKTRKIKSLIRDHRASPLIEQLIIIAVGFLILLILLGFVTGVFDWIFLVVDDATGFFDGLLPTGT